MSFRELHYRWEFDLKSSPENSGHLLLTPTVSIVIPAFRRSRSKKAKRLRNARRKVRLSIYGLPVEWEEQPFEWVRPVRFGIERVYSKGPMARMRALAELAPNRTAALT